MIIFENNLSKYIENDDWYDMKFLCLQLKGWIGHLECYEKKDYKRKEKIEEKKKQLRLATDQINKIRILIGILHEKNNE